MIKTTLRALIDAADFNDPKVGSPIVALLKMRVPPAQTLARLRAKKAIEAEVTLTLQAIRRIRENHHVTTSITEAHPAYNAIKADIDALLASEVNLPFDEIPFAEIGEGTLSPFELQALQFWIKLPDQAGPDQAGLSK